MINIMKEAHRITKKIIRSGDNYKATLSLTLQMLYRKVRISRVKITKELTTINNTDGQVFTTRETLFKTNYKESLKIMNEKFNSLIERTPRTKRTKNSIISKLDIKNGTVTKVVKYSLVFY